MIYNIHTKEEDTYGRMFTRGIKEKTMKCLLIWNILEDV